MDLSSHVDNFRLSWLHLEYKMKHFLEVMGGTCSYNERFVNQELDELTASMSALTNKLSTLYVILPSRREYDFDAEVDEMLAKHGVQENTAVSLPTPGHSPPLVDSPGDSQNDEDGMPDLISFMSPTPAQSSSDIQPESSAGRDQRMGSEAGADTPSTSSNETNQPGECGATEPPQGAQARASQPEPMWSTVELIEDESSQRRPESAPKQNLSLSGWEFAVPGSYGKTTFGEGLVDVEIGHVESPSLFYVMPFERKQYEQLFEQLQFMGQILENEQVKVEPVVDLPVMAKYTVDEQWYRASLVAVQDDYCLVQYVDYGNSETLPVSSLLPLPLVLIDLPQLARLCSLAEESTPEQTAAFRDDMTEGKRLLLQPLSEENLLCRVALFDPDTKESISAKYVDAVICQQPLDTETQPEDVHFATQLEQELIEEQSNSAADADP